MQVSNPAFHLCFFFFISLQNYWKKLPWQFQDMDMDTKFHEQDYQSRGIWLRLRRVNIS